MALHSFKPAIGRNKIREIDRDGKKIREAMDNIEFHFEHMLFFSEIDYLPIFEFCNNKWLEMAKKFNSRPNKVIHVDSTEFYKNYKPVENAN